VPYHGDHETIEKQMHRKSEVAFSSTPIPTYSEDGRAPEAAPSSTNAKLIYIYLSTTCTYFVYNFSL
jgi:hypothetical protein